MRDFQNECVDNCKKSSIKLVQEYKKVIQNINNEKKKIKTNCKNLRHNESTDQKKWYKQK